MYHEQVDFTHSKHELNVTLRFHQHKKQKRFYIIFFLLDKGTPKTISCAANYVEEYVTATVPGKQMDIFLFE